MPVFMHPKLKYFIEASPFYLYIVYYIVYNSPTKIYQSDEKGLLDTPIFSIPSKYAISICLSNTQPDLSQGMISLLLAVISNGYPLFIGQGLFSNHRILQ